jgi:hypothetical protein
MCTIDGGFIEKQDHGGTHAQKGPQDIIRQHLPHIFPPPSPSAHIDEAGLASDLEEESVPLAIPGKVFIEPLPTNGHF